MMVDAWLKPRVRHQPSTINHQPARTAFLAMLVATFFWGSLPVASKAVVSAVAPPQQALVRSASAFVVLTAFCLLAAGRGPIDVALRRPRDLAIQGFFSFCGSSLTSLMALEYISASLQAVLVATFPVILALTALDQGGVRAILGTLIALVGIAVVVGGDDPTSILAGGVDLRGVALALLTALLIAGSQLWAQRTVRRGDPMGTTAMAAGFATPMLLAIALPQGGLAPIVTAPG